MVNHLPWDPRLGAARPQFELAERFRAGGHEVDTFSYTDAFPKPPRSKVGTLLRRPFRAIATKRVAALAGGYDVIDINQGDIAGRRPMQRAGALVVRSNGLIPVYRAFAREKAREWGEEHERSLLARPVRAAQARGEAGAVRRSFVEADAIVVPNRWERDYLEDWLGLGAKTHVVPLGLGDEFFAACDALAGHDEERHAKKVVACVAMWQDRKGRRDWPAILGALVGADERIRLHLLGTGAAEGDVLDDFPEQLRQYVTVVPSYEPADLPALLAEATVGAFPSYLEAFGLGALEQLAAGLPTAAYRTPGPSDILGGIDAGALVDPGATAAMAEQILGWLALPAAEYGALVAKARGHARTFTWNETADRTMAVYDQLLPAT